MHSVPLDWKRYKLKDLSEYITAGATPSTRVIEYWDEGNIPWMSSGEINFRFIDETEKFITEKGYKNSSTSLIPEKSVLMGCYGIGLGRLMGAIIEVNNDKDGMIWPEKVAPFSVHLIQIENSSKVKKTAEKLYKDLQKNNIEVLYDDREEASPGVKFAESDLIGIPLRVLVSERTIKSNSVELKKRN